MKELGPYRLDLINDGFFEWDASSVIRTENTEDDPAQAIRYKAQVTIGFNSLLIRGRGRTILIDPGTGDKPRPDKVEAYRMEWPRKVLPTLREFQVEREAVDTVILTHLHWDHCGGATCFSADGQLVPSFPKARYFTQRSEFVSAMEMAATDPDSYLIEDYEPLQKAGVLELLDGDGEIMPGVEVRWTGGHSAGHQLVLIGKPDEPQTVFLSDLIPTSHHLPPDYAMTYDENAVELKIAKQRILEEAVLKKYLLIFVHASRVRAGYVSRGLDNRIEFRQTEI